MPRAYPASGRPLALVDNGDAFANVMHVVQSCKKGLTVHIPKSAFWEELNYLDHCSVVEVIRVPPYILLL